jgi:hypothetical protein
MAKLSDLVLRTSQVTGFPVAAVREISRRLREGRLIRTGKGGRYGGADMTPRDAAYLLTALLIVRGYGVSLTQIVQLTEIYLRSLKSYSPRGHRMVLDRWDRRLALPELCRLDRGHTFEAAFIALLASVSNRDFERSMSKWKGVEVVIKITSAGEDPEAKIEFHTGAFGRLDLFYILPETAQTTEALNSFKWSDISENTTFDLRVQATFSEVTLKSIGLLLRSAEPKDA